MDPDKNTPADDADKDVKDTTPPSGSDDGQGDSKDTKAPSDIPEKFQGKEAADIVKMYGDLERKLGEQSTTIAEAKQIKQNMEVIAKAVATDPDLANRLEKAAQKVMYGKDDDKNDDGKNKDDGEVRSKPDPRVDEMRRVTESKIIDEFANGHGIDTKSDKGKEMMKEIGKTLADLVDPSGTKTVQQVLDSIGLEHLPKALENAFWVANKDAVVEGKSEVDFASIGRMSSSNSKSEPREGLTESEKAVAKKLGVSEKDYLAYKK